ncbi:MAG: NUDIX domain-containing protein [Phototrophicaceae bacterium]
MKAGKDYIGVGVGAIVFNNKDEVFLSQRGMKAKNERGTWEFPGGSVEFGDTLRETVKREFMEEYGIEIEIFRLLAVDDHILPDEGQHWISPTYIAKLSKGEASILEAEKCSAIGWFSLDNLPDPLSLITQYNVRDYLAIYGNTAPKWDE